MLFRSPFFRRHERLHKVMAEVVEDFGLISFLPLDISSAESVGRVLARIDKSNGYIFTQNMKGPSSSNMTSAATVTNTAEDLFQCAIQTDSFNYDSIADIQERIAMGREMN